MENYYFFLAILNSVITQFIIEQKSPMFGGGYYKYHTQYIEDLPVPNINSKQANELKQSIVNMVKNLIELKHENFSNAEKSKKERIS